MPNTPGTPGINEQPAQPNPDTAGNVSSPSQFFQQLAMSQQQQIPVQPIDPWVPMTPERFFQQMVAGQNPMRQIVFHRIAEMLS